MVSKKLKTNHSHFVPAPCQNLMARWCQCDYLGYKKPTIKTNKDTTIIRQLIASRKCLSFSILTKLNGKHYQFSFAQMSQGKGGLRIVIGSKSVVHALVTMLTSSPTFPTSFLNSIAEEVIGLSCSPWVTDIFQADFPVTKNHTVTGSCK